MVASTLSFQSRKVPSYLKGLVDNRARADGQVQRLTAVIAGIEAERVKAVAQRDACDVLLRRISERFEPDSIAGIRGWMGRHGRRGDHLEAIRDFVRAAGAEGASTTDVGEYLIGFFQLDFATVEARWIWQANCVRRRLNELKSRGELETLEDPSRRRTTVQRWRLKRPTTSSVRGIADLAETFGVRVVQETEEGGPCDTRHHAQGPQLPQRAG